MEGNAGSLGSPHPTDSTPPRIAWSPPKPSFHPGNRAAIARDPERHQTPAHATRHHRPHTTSLRAPSARSNPDHALTLTMAGLQPGHPNVMARLESCHPATPRL